MYFVYVLLCSDNSLYTGSSNDPEKRFLAHKSGRGGKYTRSHKPIKILYIEKLGSKSEALQRELQIKGWSRNKKIKLSNMYQANGMSAVLSEQSESKEKIIPVVNRDNFVF